jgi:glucan phosphoethanolaminetransferase (alkaline phosphatase superfamily)
MIKIFSFAIIFLIIVPFIILITKGLDFFSEKKDKESSKYAKKLGFTWLSVAAAATSFLLIAFTFNPKVSEGWPLIFSAIIGIIVFLLLEKNKSPNERKNDQFANNFSPKEENIESFVGKSINDIYKEKVGKSLNDKYKEQNKVKP